MADDLVSAPERQDGARLPPALLLFYSASFGPNFRKENFMKKTMSKKLTLTRETIVSLTEDRAKAALGGVQAPSDPPEDRWTGDSKNVCCA
jgi:hypothetical protein